MPRINIWVNQQQLDRVHRVFGKGSNLSGVIRIALAALLAATDSDHITLTEKQVRAFTEIIDGLSETEVVADDADVRGVESRRSS